MFVNKIEELSVIKYIFKDDPSVKNCSYPVEQQWFPVGVNNSLQMGHP